MTGTTEGTKKRDPEELRRNASKGGHNISPEQHAKAGHASAQSQGHDKLSQHGATGGQRSHSGSRREEGMRGRDED